MSELNVIEIYSCSDFTRFNTNISFSSCKSFSKSNELKSILDYLLKKYPNCDDYSVYFTFVNREKVWVIDIFHNPGISFNL